MTKIDQQEKWKRRGKWFGRAAGMAFVAAIMGFGGARLNSSDKADVVNVDQDRLQTEHRISAIESGVVEHFKSEDQRFDDIRADIKDIRDTEVKILLRMDQPEHLSTQGD